MENAKSTLAADAAANRIISTLISLGVEICFGIPGGPVCPIFEAIRLENRIKLIESRHETHAAFSAASYFNTTGKIAAVIVSAGPGITNVMTGVSSAFLERIPMIVITGDVPWATHGGLLAQHGGPEGLDVEQMYSTVTSEQFRIIHSRSTVSITAAAFMSAKTTSKPVLLVVPLDVATSSAPEIMITQTPDFYQVKELMMSASHPLLVLGGATRKYAKKVHKFVDRLGVPFITTPRAKGVVSEHHPLSLRNGGMAASMWARAYTSTPVDATLVLGSDLDDSSMGPTPYLGSNGKLIHVDLNPSVFNRNVPTKLGIVSDIEKFLDGLILYLKPGEFKVIKEKTSQSPYDIPNFSSDSSSPIAPHRALFDLQAALPSARFITDIGEHMLFALHYLTADDPEAFHIQLNLGSMGSGIAGAVGLALGDETRPVVCICGDGGMQMAGMEILTAIKERLPIIYAVFNDARYNMVHHGMKQIFSQAQQYDTAPVDFESWARAMGVPAATITRSGQIDAELLKRLRAKGGPVLLDIRIDPELRIRGGGRVEALQHMSMLAQAAGEEL